jgi:hypothetical protein
MADETEKTADAALENAVERKTPRYIIDQEIPLKSGQVLTNRMGAAFEREDGALRILLDAEARRGELIMRTPEQRLEAMKNRDRSGKSRGHER